MGLEDGKELEGTLRLLPAFDATESHADNSIAWLEARDGSTDFDDLAGDIGAENVGIGGPGEEGGAEFAPGPVDGVEGYGVVLDEDFVRAGRGVGCELDFEGLFVCFYPRGGVGRHCEEVGELAADVDSDNKGGKKSVFVMFYLRS